MRSEQSTRNQTNLAAVSASAPEDCFRPKLQRRPESPRSSIGWRWPASPRRPSSTRRCTARRRRRARAGRPRAARRGVVGPAGMSAWSSRVATYSYGDLRRPCRCRRSSRTCSGLARSRARSRPARPAGRGRDVELWSRRQEPAGASLSSTFFAVAWSADHVAGADLEARAAPPAKDSASGSGAARPTCRSSASPSNSSLKSVGQFSVTAIVKVSAWRVSSLLARSVERYSIGTRPAARADRRAVAPASRRR